MSPNRLYLTRLLAKILLFFLTTVLILSCNAVKRLEADQNLLVKNEIFANDELVKDSRIKNQLYQEPNTKLLGFPLRLHFYNLARPEIDSILTEKFLENESRRKRLTAILSKKQFDQYIYSKKEFNQWIKRTGEAPVVLNKEQADKSVNRLKSWYWNNGWFNVEADYKVLPIENKEKRAKVEYYIKPGKPYTLDSLTTEIASPALDSLYQSNKTESEIIAGTQYNTIAFNEERDRLSDLFRNNGVYNFDQEYISFDADTVDTNHRLNTTLIIKNERNNIGDSITRTPFKIHTISKVKIFTDYSFANRNMPILDSATYRRYELFSFDEMRYKPEAVTDAVFIRPGMIYRDLDRTRTYNRLNSLRVFKYPNIQYTPDPSDSTNTKLISNIFLSPLPKYSLGFDFDVSQSNIQKFGIGFGGSFLIRNIFGGLENLELSGRGSIASSTDAAASADKNRFFDITEVGADLKLTLPRIFLPIDTERLIKKYMAPFTSMSLGFSSQRNIGLDKQTFSGILNYNWNPSKQLTNSLDLLNIQYVRNLNTENYFNVYRNSFEELNSIAQRSNFNFSTPGSDLQIPEEADGFIDYVINEDRTNTGLENEDYLNTLDIYERKLRLTQNNLIFASSYTYLWNTRENLYDREFSRFRFKLETAGNVLSALSNVFNYPVNDQGNEKVLGVAYSQYVKTELDFIKHWDLGNDQIFAVRAFGGIAIPYGNANDIPITKTFFAGGPNDNRAWQAYDLGPGSSGSILEFNEANLKLAFNGEYRFGIFDQFKGALFVDVGNIWNVLDSRTSKDVVFEEFSDLEELAVGSGFGLRYDFNFFVLRFDIGFKTHDPGQPEGDRWFQEYNFNHAVYNVGINYPF